MQPGREKGETWTRTLLGSDRCCPGRNCATITRKSQSQTCALLPGDATRGWGGEVGEGRSAKNRGNRNAVRLFAPRTWGSGDEPVGQGLGAPQLDVAVCARNYTWNVDRRTVTFSQVCLSYAFLLVAFYSSGLLPIASCSFH